MADPLSISASIAGLITLTDVVFLGLMKYIGSMKNAAKEIKDLTNEINYLGGALHSLSRLAQAFNDEPTDYKTFRMYHIKACNDILANMSMKLKKFDDGNTLAKKVTWPFSSTRAKELQNELSRHKQNIELALSANSMELLLRSLGREEDLQKTASEIKADLEKIKGIVCRIDDNRQREKKQDKQQAQNEKDEQYIPLESVRSFFLRHNPQQNYDMSLKLRQPGTGLWLLHLPNFQRWLSIPNGKLWLSGIPGAGKTVLAGTIIEASLRQCNNNVAAAFFFCDYKAEATHSPDHIISVLAYQIAIQKEEAYKILEQYFRELHPGKGLPRDYTTNGLGKVIRDMIKLFHQVHIIVDGIDECGQLVEEVLGILCSLSDDSNNISMALLSRDEHNIRSRLEDDFVCEKVAAHTGDITEYVTAQIEERMRIKKLHIDDLNLKGEIMQSLIDGAAGMFRWVACQLDHLEQCDSDQECREALKKLPPNLNETYLRILVRIAPGLKTRRTQLILNFIAFASPSLSILQLREAISIPENGGSLEPSGLVRENTIQKLCSSFIRKSNDENRFEFAHFSVQEFLENESILQGQFSQFLVSQSQCNKLMAIQCLKYLQLENFNYTLGPTMEQFSHRVTRRINYRFYKYAVRRWPYYAIEEWTDGEIIQLAKKLFSLPKTTFFSSWIIEFIVDDGTFQPDFDNYMNTVTRVNHRYFTPLHVACIMSLPIISSHLIQGGADVNKDSPIGTPIQCAMGSLLLFSTNMGTELLAYLGCMKEKASILAAENIRSLLEAGAKRFRIASNFDEKTRLLKIALQVLRHTNDSSVITLFLSEGLMFDETDIATFSDVLDSSFDWKASDPDTTFKALIKTLNSMINISSFHRKLCLVAWQLAINKGLCFTSDPYLVDSSILLSLEVQEQQLIEAVRNNDVAAFEKIQEGSNLNTSKILDKDGNGLLHIALNNPILRSSSLMVETLGKAGYNFLQSSKDGDSPIHWWLRHGKTEEEIVIEPLINILLNYGLTVCSQDELGGNVLHYSCNKPHYLSAFLKYGSETNVASALRMVDRDGYTPLSKAIKGGPETSASLLFKRCKTDPKTWQSPIPILQLAIQRNCQDILKNTLELKGLSTEIADNTFSPLHYIGTTTSTSFVKYPTYMYPNTYYVCAEGKLPLSIYIKQRFEYLVHREVLLKGTAKISEIIPTLYPYGSPENEMRIWEDFTKIVFQNKGQYDNKRKKMCTIVITKLIQLGCLSSYETISQRPALFALLEDLNGQFQNLRDIRPITSQIICDVIDHSNLWLEIQTSPLIIKLLKAAVLDNNIGVVGLLCQKGVSVHQRVEDCSALEIACQSYVHGKTFQLLLYHADNERLNETNLVKNGLGLIHRLAFTDGSFKLKKLLERGANPNLLTENFPNLSALAFHIDKGQIKSPLILLKYGADPTQPTTNNQADACLVAAQRGYINFLKIIYKMVTPKWNPNWQRRCNASFIINGKSITVSGCCALHLAASSGNVHCLSFYINQSLIPDVNTTTDSGFTLLHIAALEGHTEIIEFLTARGADINARTSSNDLPLHFAIMNERLSAAELLIRLGSDNTMNNLGISPYLHAWQLGNQHFINLFHRRKQHIVLLEGVIKNGNTELCGRLFQEGYHINADLPSCNGCSPLLLAARYKKPQIIRLLLAHKASTLKISCWRHGYLSCIHHILRDKDLAIVLWAFLQRYLSDGGNLLSESPGLVYTATEHDNLKGLQTLLAHLQQNARHYTNDIVGEDSTSAVAKFVNQRASGLIMLSPLHLAAQNGLPEFIECLLRSGADANAQTQVLRTPLHEAISSKAPGARRVVKILINHGVDIDCRDRHGRTPLMHACLNRNWELVKLLLDAGADPNRMDHNLNGLLHLAMTPAISRPSHSEFLTHLQIFKLDPHQKNINGVSAIHLAIGHYQLSPLILNGFYEFQRIEPIPWSALPSKGNISWLTEAFTMFRRKIPIDTLRKIANTDSSNFSSPLCMSASAGLLQAMENLLSLGANIEFEGCPDGTALMSACYAGMLESVIFLVRRGAVLAYHGLNGFRTALDKNKTPKRILQWLLVTRFTDQAKITEAPNNCLSAEPVVIRSWGGVTKAELVISENLERRPGQSSKDYWIFLMKEKKRWRGRVVPTISRRRTVRPSKIIPLEPVRIHPDGYEVPKVRDAPRT